MIGRRHFLAMAAVTLSGCGFKLKQKPALPAAMKRVAITSDLPDEADVTDDAKRAMTDSLKRELNRVGSTVVGPNEQATAILHMAHSEYQKNVRTTDAVGRATSYTLKHIVKFEVLSAEDTTLLPLKELETVRVLLSDSKKQLASQGEEDFVKDNVHSHAAQKIVEQMVRGLAN